MDVILEFLQSGVLPTVLLIVRALVPLLALYVVWRCYTSFKKGQRRRDPVIMLWDEASGTRFPVLYWENSIGRSRSCDIYLPDPSASRDHAVLLRRDEGWFICDTGSKSGVLVNGKKIEDRKLVSIGDTITMGSTTLTMWNADQKPLERRRFFTGFSREAASPLRLMLAATFTLLLVALQGLCMDGELHPEQLIPFAAVLVMGWGLYIFSIGVMHRVSFEIETVAFLLSGIGVQLLSAFDIEGITTQLAAMLLGMLLFCFMIWFMGDMDRVAKCRLWIGLGAILLLAATLVLGTNTYGSTNWIRIGPLSVQPSEFVKIAFIFVGTSTLDRLQTKKNIGEFLIFTGACIGLLALMPDFGMALILFATFLIIAFMRSGSVRTIALVLAGAVLAVFVVLTVKPYVLDRFMGWGHVWEHINDNLGYSQTRTLTYLASGGLFGVGLGNSYLASVFAADSDLVFGLLCEEQGLLLGLVILLAFVLWIFYARSDVTRSRSTFFSIAVCAAAGMLLFQTALNVFGATDVLPMTGVTLPFISSGGSSMISVWGMMAFLKASDERTYAARRASRRSLREEAPPPPSRTPQSRAPQRAPAPRPQASPSRGRVTPPAPQRAPARSPAPRGGSHARKPAGRHSRKEA